jgi:hypothetical protein
MLKLTQQVVLPVPAVATPRSTHLAPQQHSRLPLALRMLPLLLPANVMPSHLALLVNRQQQQQKRCLLAVTAVLEPGHELRLHARLSVHQSMRWLAAVSVI